MRLELWEHRLADLIASAQQRTFQYGTFDCALFAAEAIEALTGVDPAADLRGTYETESEAIAILKPSRGLKGLAQRMAGQYGFQRITPAFAQRGDIVLAKIDRRHTLGVCIGARVAFPASPSGLAYLPMDSGDIVTCWRID